MMDTQPCAALLADDVTRLYNLLKSDGGQLLVAALATARAVVRYCGQSRYLEARELASSIVVIAAVAILVAAQEAQVPQMLRQAVACKGQELPTTTVSRTIPRAGGVH